MVLGNWLLFNFLNCIITVIGACLRERAPLGIGCCMIISDSDGGKCERKSLGDREGPHASQGRSFLDFFDPTLLRSRSSFVRPFPGEDCKSTALRCLCV